MTEAFALEMTPPHSHPYRKMPLLEEIAWTFLFLLTIQTIGRFAIEVVRKIKSNRS